MNHLQKIRLNSKFVCDIVRRVGRIQGYSSCPKCGHSESDSSAKGHTIDLSNGMEIPVIGLGTWGSVQIDAKIAVLEAVKVGYRLIDCAHFYQNEKHIGMALSEIQEEGKVTREELFIVSKLWNTFHRPDLVEKAICMSLKDLGLEYLDLYLMHWPMAFQEDGKLMPLNACGRVNFSRVSFLDTWKEMEKLVEKGLTKSIGVANFNVDQLECILDKSDTPPVVNQIECHPFLTQKEILDFCLENDIAVMAFSPLGSPGRPGAAKDDDNKLMEDKTVNMLAEKHKKTPAQILIRYQIQSGNIAIPKSVTKERIHSNIEVFDWCLEDDDMEKLDELNRDHRYYPFKISSKHPDYPFTDDFSD